MKLRPNILDYHNYREYLKDMLNFFKNQARKKSLRQIARELEISPSYLSMIVNGSRDLDESLAMKMAEVFKCSESETSFLKNIINFSDAQVEEKHDSFKKITRFGKYKEKNKKEVEAYKYLTRWYHVAIREMAALPDFKADPKWVQERLIKRVSLKEIKSALEFLIKNGFITINQSLQQVEHLKKIDCMGGVYKLSLSSFHKQMLTNAVDSIYEVESAKRNILGHTVAMSEAEFEQAKLILNEALEKIKALALPDEKKTDVYHISFLGFPLSLNKEGKNENS